MTLYLLLLLLLISACSSSFEVSPALISDQIAAKAKLQKAIIPTSHFLILTYGKFQDASHELVVYIEGDGFAWKNRYELSADPTPLRPLVLTLATLDHRRNVLYLSRPCQYETLRQDARCHPKFWSGQRFSPLVVESLLQAILTFQRKGQKLILVGFSGGANLAAILASKLQNVYGLITVAGNLDHEGLHRFHQVSPLQGSLNALDFTKQLQNIPQRHFLGSRDEIIPSFILKNFLKNLSPGPCVLFSSIEDVGHEEGWEERWPSLVRTALDCQSQKVFRNEN